MSTSPAPPRSAESAPRNAWWLSALAPLVLAVLAAAIVAGRASAAGPASTSIDLRLASPVVTIGQDLAISARLTSGGAPITSRRLSIFLDGVFLRTLSVDPNGVAGMTIKGKALATAGTAVIKAVFAGSGSALAPTERTKTVEIRPATLKIVTVPATDNIKISVGAQAGITKHGVVSFRIDKLGSYRITPVITNANDATRTDFVRWADNVFDLERDVIIEGDKELDLGLHVAYRGSFRFVDDAGNQLSPGAIQSVLLTSTGGSQLNLTRFDDVWLEAGTAVKRGEGLGAVAREWRVLEVRMAGTTVVNRGQQQVEPGPSAVWTVSVLLFDLRVTAQDAIFGGPLTGDLKLAYPDGTTSAVRLDGSNPADFARLPRGDYVLRFSTAGLGAPTPVSLSRDQTSVIRVITYLDLGVVGALMLISATGLVWLGRRSQVLVVVRRSRPWLSQTVRALSGQPPTAGQATGRRTAGGRAAGRRPTSERAASRRATGRPGPLPGASGISASRPASNAAYWIESAHEFGARTWSSFREEAKLLGMGLRLAPAQLSAWAVRQIHGLWVAIGRLIHLLQVLVRGLDRSLGIGANAARRRAGYVSRWFATGRTALQATSAESLQASRSAPPQVPVVAGSALRSRLRPVAMQRPVALPDPIEPQAVASPTIAQTIPQTFERSIPGSMKRLVGSRYRAELLPQTQKGRCPNCRRLVPWQAAYCAGCGSRLPTLGPPA